MGREMRKGLPRIPLGLRGDDSGEATTARSTPPEHPGKGITMSFLHCGSTPPSGRFCNRCGKQILPAALAGRGVPVGRRADAAARPVTGHGAGGAR